MRVGGQRMGSGFNSCMNINNWNHLFSPNSSSAQQGAFNCFEHWSRVAPGGGRNVNTTRSGQDSMVRYAPGAGITVNPDRKILEKTLIVAVAALVVWFFVFRQ